jgi:hypothetical protein
MADILHFDLRAFEREAKRLGAAIDQVPYASVSQLGRIAVVQNRPGVLGLLKPI